MTNEEIDEKLDLESIQTDQDAYFNVNGFYYRQSRAPTQFAADVFLSVTSYDGPKGKGYTINVESGTWMKVVNYGPETYRDVDWFDVSLDG